MKSQKTKIDKIIDNWASKYRWNYDCYKEEIAELKSQLNYSQQEDFNVVKEPADKIFTRKDFDAFGELCATLRTDYLLASIEKHAKEKYKKFSKTIKLKIYPDGYKDFGITFKEIEKIFRENVK